MNVSIEALKNSQEKYIFCRIEVVVRSIFYFAEQKRPHRTHRWLSNEQWALYDRKLKELLLDNKLENVNQLQYKLDGSLILQINKSQVSKKSLYNALSNSDISLIDVINVIDCKLVYQDENINYGGVQLTPNEIDVNEGTTGKLCSTENGNIGKNSEDFEVVASQVISLDSSPSPMTVKNDKSSLTLENINCLLTPSKSDDVENVSPIFHAANNSSGTVDLQTNETSSDSTDIAERILMKLSNNNYNDVPAQSDELSSKKSTLKPFHDNESPNSDIQTSPTEKRKRKLYSNTDYVNEKRKQKESTSQKHKLPNDEIDNKSSQKEAAHKSRSSSAPKTKKSRRERSKSPCLPEKRAMDTWLGKTKSKDYDKGSKSDKPTTSTHSSSSHRHNDKKSSGQKKHNSPHKSSKSTERSSSNDKHTKQCKVVAKNDCNLVDNLKDSISTEPQNVRILDLTSVPTAELLATFEEHRAELERIFKTQKLHKKFVCADGVDHYLVINLVTNKVQQKLMEKLSELEKADDGTPKHGDLFSMVLMPEWILRVFMAKFQMSRSEAITHIKAQNDFNALKTFTAERLDKMASKK